MVYLSNPGMPPGSLDQLTYELFTGTGLTLIIHGPFDLADTVAEAQRVMPFFADSEVLDNGLAAHPACLSAWVGMDGPTGSAIALFVHPDDSSYLAREVVGRLNELSPGFTSSMAHGGDIDDAAGEHLEGAVSVPARDFL